MKKISLIAINLTAITVAIFGVACSSGSSSNPSPAPTPTTQTYAYVADSSSSIWRCLADSNGRFGQSCLALTNSTAPGFKQTRSVQFQKFSLLGGSVTYAYVTDTSSNLWQCQLSGSTFSSCKALTNGTTPFNTTMDVTFKSFNNTLYAYVSDASSIVWQCPVDSSTGGFSVGCVALTSGLPFPFQNTSSISFITSSQGTNAFVADLSANLWICPMIESTGTILDTCFIVGIADPTHLFGFNQTSAVVATTFNNTRYIYVSNFNNTLLQCPYNKEFIESGGASVCSQLTTSNPPFNQTSYASFATFAGTTYAYVGDQDSYILQCPINPATGGFNSMCTKLTNSAFKTPNAISFSTQ